MKWIEKIVERKESPVIIVADAGSKADNIDTCMIFIELFNSITKGKYKLCCDFNKDYYRIDLKNVSDTIIKINEITEKIKDKSFVLVSTGIRNEMWTYYEKVEPYFDFMARSAGKFIDIGSYIEPIDILFKQS